MGKNSKSNPIIELPITYRTFSISHLSTETNQAVSIAFTNVVDLAFPDTDTSFMLKLADPPSFIWSNITAMLFPVVVRLFHLPKLTEVKEKLPPVGTPTQWIRVSISRMLKCLKTSGNALLVEVMCNCYVVLLLTQGKTSYC